jgi:hypothetical protein
MASQRIAMTATVAIAVPALILAFWAIWRFDPSEYAIFPPCLFHKLTGLHCPGCGGTRAAHALLHGDLLAAVRFNALLVVGFPTMALAFWLQRSAERLGRNRFRNLAVACASVFLAFTLVRNLPTPWTSPFAPPRKVNRLANQDDTAMDRDKRVTASGSFQK